jgi:hypothetical protein
MIGIGYIIRVGRLPQKTVQMVKYVFWETSGQHHHNIWPQEGKNEDKQLILVDVPVEKDVYTFLPNSTRVPAWMKDPEGKPFRYIQFIRGPRTVRYGKAKAQGPGRAKIFNF